MPNTNGWIRLHRSLTKWGWYSDSNTCRVFIHLLLTANFEPSEFRGKKIDKGQAVFGLLSLAENLELSVRSVRTSLEHLKSTGELTIETTNKYSVATIVKYSLYQYEGNESDKQNDTQTDNPSTNDRQTTDKRPTTSKNIRREEYKKDKKDNDCSTEQSTRATFKPPTVDEVAAYCRERCNAVVAQQWHDFYTSKGWKIGKSPMKDWKAAVRTWERNGINGGADRSRDKDFADRNFEQQNDYTPAQLAGMKTGVFDLEEI
jgi:hypothetical protein